ncbi:hypothetical protein [Methylobacillus sp. MM3]|uniref:plasmid mobilization protein n=1 Tax=Methylobacillus sp. MM3 TaxID=1848039 RepID=UPI0009EDBA54|nr:hypothetical protein [Methylobacillus sp. MM3]
MDTMPTQPTQPTRRRGGRPRLPDIERRNIKTTITLNRLEAEQLMLKSEDAGMDGASYIRVAALGNTITAVPAINREAYVKLARLAGNVNQLMRHINSSSSVVVNGQQLGAGLEKLRAEVQALRAALLGA